MKPKTSSKHKKTRKPKEEVLPTTVNTLLLQGLFPNGLMQVTPDYFSQSYLLEMSITRRWDLKIRERLWKPIQT